MRHTSTSLEDVEHWYVRRMFAWVSCHLERLYDEGWATEAKNKEVDYLYYLKDRLARTIQEWQRIHFDSLSDKYVTSMYFDEFIISFDLIA